MNEAKSKLANANQDVTAERRKVGQMQTQISKVQKEIRTLNAVLQDPKKLKDAARNCSISLDHKSKKFWCLQ